MESKNAPEILLGWLSADPEEAELLYLEMRRKLLIVFRNSDDPEELFSEAISRAIVNIEIGRVDLSGNPLHYIASIARRVRLENYRKTIKTASSDKMEETADEPFEEQIDDPRYQIIEDCLNEIDHDDKEVFLDYTFPPEGVSAGKHRDGMAAAMDVTIPHLRVRIFRIKKTIRDCALEKLKNGQ